MMANFQSRHRATLHCFNLHIWFDHFEKPADTLFSLSVTLELTIYSCVWDGIVTH